MTSIDWEWVCNRIENVKQLLIELSVIFQGMTHFLEMQIKQHQRNSHWLNCSLSVARNSHVGHLPIVDNATLNQMFINCVAVTTLLHS